jgi:hypothetical protein
MSKQVIYLWHEINVPSTSPEMPWLSAIKLSVVVEQKDGEHFDLIQMKTKVPRQ